MNNLTVTEQDILQMNNLEAIKCVCLDLLKYSRRCEAKIHSLETSNQFLETTVELQNNKKKVIVSVSHVLDTNRQAFVETLNTAIVGNQQQGLEVEVHYQNTDTNFAALVLGYKYVEGK